MEIPTAVLSEHFQDRLRGRTLVAAVFTTFQFEPGFFETEILPVFLNVALSHALPIRIAQLETALTAKVSVYYDQHGLVPAGGAAQLDVRRVPIRHRTGIFHPKNVFALVEEADLGDGTQAHRSLLCASSSANLTRAGWWENVEVAHVEEIAQGAHSAIAQTVLEHLDGLVATAEGIPRANDEYRAKHPAIGEIRSFLRAHTTQRDHRSVNGKLLTHFHDRNEGFTDFLDRVAGPALQGTCLEVIAPYIDSEPPSRPLEALLDRFGITEARVFLPQQEDGTAACSQRMFEWVRTHRQLSWGVLPRDLLRLGKSERARQRNVHAKVYRFFEPKRGGRELLYIGSPNLTAPGCRVTGKGGNWETGFLVELPPGKRDWWLSDKSPRPTAFESRDEGEGVAAEGGSSLTLRYHWDTKIAQAHWAGGIASPSLSVQYGGREVLSLSGLTAGTWTNLSSTQSAGLAEILPSSSLLEVHGETERSTLLLVQEEGLSHRPSLMFKLSTAEILQFWSLLSPRQQAEFLEQRLAMRIGADDPLLARVAPLLAPQTLFDRFAGVFHAFASKLERVTEALDRDDTREADYRVFGRKHDSLGPLLERVLEEQDAGAGDAVEGYIILLCARQLAQEVQRLHPEYWRGRAEIDRAYLKDLLARSQEVRQRLTGVDPTLASFLDWYEPKFLKRAQPQEEAP